jgi:hypothetical protein
MYLYKLCFSGMVKKRPNSEFPLRPLTHGQMQMESGGVVIICANHLLLFNVFYVHICQPTTAISSV